jgi:sugar lactone lactonase YvrE
MIHEHEKSDPPIVAVKPANKTERSAAELEKHVRCGGSFPPFAGVYRVSADLGTMTLLLDNLRDGIVQPNGLTFSPDESVL